MNVAEAIQEVVSARARLAGSVSSAAAWSDSLREQFDVARLRPLTDSGAALEKALRRAQDQLTAAQELLKAD